MQHFLFFVSFVIFHCSLFSQNKSRCFEGRYNSDDYKMYVRIQLDTAISKHYTHIFNIYYHGLHLFDEYDQQYEHDFFYCKQVDSVFYLAKDSTYFNLRRFQGYFDDELNMIITDASFMNYEPNEKNILIEYVPWLNRCGDNETMNGDEGTYDPISPPEVENIEIDTNYIHDYCDESPTFPGGYDSLLTFISANLIYPEISKEAGISGKVYVQFVVEKDGSLTNIRVVRGLDWLTDKEAIRIVSSMPKWIPGKFEGKIVRVRIAIPVSFKLE